MSRTIRRRKISAESWFGPESEICDQEIRRWGCRDAAHLIKKRDHWLHSCRSIGFSNSPRWYRQAYYNRPERRLEALLMHQVTKGTLEDAVFPGRRRGANVAYWWMMT